MTSSADVGVSVPVKLAVYERRLLHVETLLAEVRLSVDGMGKLLGDHVTDVTIMEGKVGYFSDRIKELQENLGDLLRMLTAHVAEESKDRVLVLRMLIATLVTTGTSVILWALKSAAGA